VLALDLDLAAAATLWRPQAGRDEPDSGSEVSF
jgi:hypothetical protein